MSEATEDLRYHVAIDCDPGRDDAIAILAALGSPQIAVDLVTTVAGNVPVEQATANALHLLRLAGMGDGVPVHPGANRPLQRSPAPVDEVHGDLIRANDRVTGPAVRSAGPADAALRQWLSSPWTIPRAIIAIGPLTNLGRLLQEDPAALDTLDALYIMGGTLSRQATRISPTAEFNFYADPDAAALVLASGRPVYLVDYDASTACQVPAPRIERIVDEVGSPVGDHLHRWLHHLYEHSNRPYGRSGIAIHDLYAVSCAAGIEPERWERHAITVDTSDDRRGTIERLSDGTDSEVYVARNLDVQSIERFLIESCRRLRR